MGDLKLSIREAIDSPSFNQLKASGANVKETRQLLAVLISKYASMLTVGGNLQPNHPMMYAESIIQDNPSMSLDDFNILMANGVKGKYNDNDKNKLYRLDILVIYEWIRAYQEEFWEVKENLPRQKSALEFLPDEKLIELQQVILSAEIKPVRTMTEEEVLEEGRAKLVKHLGKDMTMKEYQEYVVFKKELLSNKPINQEKVIMDELRKKYIAEKSELTFEEWIKM